MRRSERKDAEPDLGVLAGRLLFAVQKELFDTMEQQGYAQLGPRYGAVLAYLDEEGTRATDLAQMSGQHKQVIGNLIDELVELGIVRREPDPQDRRAKLIVPTELGLARMRSSDAIMAGIEKRLAKAVGTDAYASFKRSFQDVANILRSSS